MCEHLDKEQDGVFAVALSTLTTAEWEHLDQVGDTENARAADAILATRPGSRELEPAGADRAVISTERPIVA